MKVRFAHFYSEVARRLVATIATTELSDGSVAVGVSRVAPMDQARKDVGRVVARKRMQFVVDSFGGRQPDCTQERFQNDTDLSLCFRMAPADFIREVIEKKFFVRLASARNSSEFRRMVEEFNTFKVVE